MRMIVIRLYKVLIDTYKLLLIPKDTHLLSQESLYSAKGRLLVLLGYFKNLLWQGQLVSSQQTMLAIMGNALQPTQRLFVITNVEPE